MCDTNINTDTDTDTSLPILIDMTTINIDKKIYTNTNTNTTSYSDIQLLTKRSIDTKFGEAGGFKFVYNYLNSSSFNPIGTSACTASGKTTCIAQACAAYSLMKSLSTSTSTSTSISTSNNSLTIITIPQRSSARNMCSYLNKNLHHDLFGYAIHGETYIPKTCRVLFCTTGWALMKLLYDPSFKFDVFVLDEAHDTNMDTSLVFFSLVQMIKTLKMNFKLIISSATIDKKEYKNIFKKLTWFDSDLNSSNSPKSPNNTIHPMQFLKKDPPDAKRKEYNELIVKEVLSILNDTNVNTHHIIVHVDGQERIETLYTLLTSRPETADILICPLYSQLSKEEQSLAINQSFKRKIILATNIVESSITIDGLLYGICMPYHKVPKITNDGYTTLELVECAKGNIIQRHGRIGRGMSVPGFTKVLMTEVRYKNLKPSPEKEITFSPLFNPILKFYGSFFVKDVSIYDFFAGIKKTRIDSDISYLIDHGLLSKAHQITDVGRYVIALGTSIPIGHVMYYAAQSIKKEYWYSLCVILSMRELKMNPFYQPRSRETITTPVTTTVTIVDLPPDFSDWYGSDDMDTLFGLLIEYQSQYKKKASREWIKNNSMYDRFFRDIIYNTEKLYTSMCDVFDVDINADSPVFTIYPYHMIKTTMIELLITHMPDRVFYADGQNYIPKKIYDECINKKLSIIKQYYEFIVDRTKTNIEYVIQYTDMLVTNGSGEIYKPWMEELSSIINILNTLVDTEQINNCVHIDILKNEFEKLTNIINKAKSVHKYILNEHLRFMNIELAQMLSTGSDANTDTNTGYDRIKYQIKRMDLFAQNESFIDKGCCTYYDGLSNVHTFANSIKKTPPINTNLKKIKDDAKKCVITSKGKFSIGKDVKYKKDTNTPFMIIALNVFVTNNQFGYLSCTLIPDRSELTTFELKAKEFSDFYDDIVKRLNSDTSVPVISISSSTSSSSQSKIPIHVYYGITDSDDEYGYEYGTDSDDSDDEYDY